MKTLNLFYEEPDPDRWIKFDRYPRRWIRRLIRGKARPGGVMMVALELMRGLDKIGRPYRFNDFNFIKQNPQEIACVIGKPQILKKFKGLTNPIIFGAGIFSHPRDFPDLLAEFPTIRRILVPGPWMKVKFDPYYGEDMVSFWPVGIDTQRWSSAIKKNIPPTDFLIYDKIRWEHDHFEDCLIKPIIDTLVASRLSYTYIRYGAYNHDELIAKLSEVKGVIFLCEHETQGLAYQQMLATDTPLLAWDRGGHWKDPSYFPEIKFGPVTSVPYWDDNCGVKFTNIDEFPRKLEEFLLKRDTKQFSSRKFIVDNLTLESSAQKYLDFVAEVEERT